MAARMAYTALVAGSTGAVGRELVAQLVASAQCARVIALTRRDVHAAQYAEVFPSLMVDGNERKLEIRKVDFDALSESDINAEDKIDAAFWCLGTDGRGPTEDWYRVDVGYLVKAGALIKEAKTPYFGLVTSYGADTIRWLTCMRAKAECEAKIKAMEFERMSIFRPAFMLRGNLARTEEKCITPFFPSVTVEAVAKGMVLDYETGTGPGRIWSHWDLRKLH